MAIDTIGANALATSAVTTAKIAADAVTSAKIPAGAVVASDVADGSVTTAKLADNAVTSAKALNLGRRNIIINGAMNIAQRAASVTGLGNGGGYYTLDRHRFSSGNTAGRLTQSQASITDLPGFANAMKLDCTTADTSIAANEDCSLQYRLEGQDLQQLKKGTSSAESVTVSFYMKTNKAFTFMCELDDTDNNRFNGQQFTTSTSWTRHTLTFVGDTTGTLDDNNERSMMLNFWLHAGSNFTSGTYTANTWQSRAATDTNRAVGIGSFYDNTANELHLTGLQMEVGATATDFEHRSVGEELATCQRYFIKSGNAVTGNEEWFPGVATHSGVGRITAQSLDGNQDRALAHVKFPTHMRGNPTIVYYPGRSALTQTAGSIAVYNGNTAVTTSGKPLGRANGLQGYFQGTSTDAAAYVFQFTADAEL